MTIDPQKFKQFTEHKDAIIAEETRRTEARIRAKLAGLPEPQFQPMPELNELAYFA